MILRTMALEVCFATVNAGLLGVKVAEVKPGRPRRTDSTMSAYITLLNQAFMSPLDTIVEPTGTLNAIELCCHEYPSQLEKPLELMLTRA
jgi:hypothetical protein